MASLDIAGVRITPEVLQNILGFIPQGPLTAGAITTALGYVPLSAINNAASKWTRWL